MSDTMRPAPAGGSPLAPGGPGEPLIDAEPVGRPRPAALPVDSSRLLLGVSIVLVALNLRPLFASLSAVLPDVLRGTGLQPGAGSLMTTLPVLCMGVFAPFAASLSRRLGPERTVLALMALLCLGTGLRGLGTVPALLVGATLAGASIAVGNVLLPGLVKRHFPDRLGLMTGLFTTAMSVGAAGAAGLTVPFEHWLGGSWALALAAWAMPAGLVALLWSIQAWPARPSVMGMAGVQAPLWRSGLAWQVTLFMGLQSALAYCVFGYLAPILRERGLDAASAGLVVSFSVASQCAACLVVPMFAVRRPDQRVVNLVFFVLTTAGLLGCMFAPLGTVWLWAFVQGIGQGGVLTLAMTAIVLRSPDAGVAARLSGMAQSVGYTLASLGPLAVGLLRGATGSYAAAAVLFVAIGAVGCFNAWGAGRARVIEDAPGDR